MAEVIQNAENEFWRAPMAVGSTAQAPAGQTFVEACDRCSTEFVMGAAFCHVCGAPRHPQPVIVASRSWTRYLEFHFIQDRLGLPTTSFVAFFLGVGFLLAAAITGFIFSASTVLDWQAVQLWRIEWLLAAIAAFVAGILLRK
ncbi:MAG TPA: hypothetical protein VEV41_06965 [Terriglobales bacterium]|jgi:hypothetical protein|nr:hypothetical protein [Terriglobales bacterium]